MFYMLIPSWHFPYAMNTWLIYANEGFDGVLNTNRNVGVLGYRHVVRDFNDGGGQGGEVNAHWNGDQQTICFVYRGMENHLLLLWVVALFDSLVLSQCGGLALPMDLEGMFYIWVCSVISYCCMWRFSILLRFLCFVNAGERDSKS